MAERPRIQPARWSAPTRLVVGLGVVILLVILGLAGISSLLGPPGQNNQSRSSINDYLANGGFESGDLTGWNVTGNARTESSTVYEGTHAVILENVNTANALEQCTYHASPSACASLNDSTISQDISNVPVNAGTQFRLAVYPSFGYPSFLQVTVLFNQGITQVLDIYYLVTASSQQCSAYQQQLLGAYQPNRAEVYCLTLNQGQWNPITRSLGRDVPAGMSMSTLSGTSVSVNISFAGGNVTDSVYIDSVFFGQ